MTRTPQFESAEATSFKSSGDKTSAYLSDHAMKALAEAPKAQTPTEDISKLSLPGGENSFASNDELLNQLGLGEGKEGEADAKAKDQKKETVQEPDNLHEHDRKNAKDELNNDDKEKKPEKSVEDESSQTTLTRAESTTNDLNSSNDVEPSETIGETVATFEADQIAENDSNSQFTTGDKAVSSSAPSAMS